MTVQSLTLELLRTEKPFFSVTVEGVACSVAVFNDLSGEFLAEVRWDVTL